MKKTCYLCGTELYVSVHNCDEPYICPKCTSQWRQEQRKALNARINKREQNKTAR